MVVSGSAAMLGPVAQVARARPPVALTAVVDSALLRSKIRPSETLFLVLNLYSTTWNWMSRTQLAFNSGDLAFQEIITSRPNVNSATRVVSLNAVLPVTATFPSTPRTGLGAIGTHYS